MKGKGVLTRRNTHQERRQRVQHTILLPDGGPRAFAKSERAADRQPCASMPLSMTPRLGVEAGMGYGPELPGLGPGAGWWGGP